MLVNLLPPIAFQVFKSPNILVERELAELRLFSGAHLNRQPRGDLWNSTPPPPWGLRCLGDQMGGITSFMSPLRPALTTSIAFVGSERYTAPTAVDFMVTMLLRPR